MRLKYADNMNAEKKEEAFNLRVVLMALEIESLRSRIDERDQCRGDEEEHSRTNQEY